MSIGHALIADALEFGIAEATRRYLAVLIAAIFQIFDGAQVIGVGALRGLTDVRIPAILTFATYWLLSLPLGHFLAFHTRLGPQGPWIGLAAGLAAAAIALVWRLLHKIRVQLDQEPHKLS